MQFMYGKVYDKHILKVLSDVGENGISVQNLAVHVYNMSCSLFERPDMHEVHRYVQQYLLRNSKSSSSLIECLPRRGYYRLNTSRSADARQLMLDFSEQEERHNEVRMDCVDLSLSLFD